MATIYFVQDKRQTSGTLANVLALAETAILRTLPKGVSNRPRLAASYARILSRKGFHSAYGLRIELSPADVVPYTKEELNR